MPLVWVMPSIRFRAMMPLLAWSQDAILAHRSGYQVLADYMKAETIVTKRRDPSAALPLFLTRIARRLACSRWYAGGSLEMERKLWQRCHQDFTGLIHLLWCDRDLGYLDWLVKSPAHPLVGTFHQCADDLPAVIRRPSALKKFAAIVLMSDSQRSYFLQHGVAPERLHRILHGVDVDHFTPLPYDTQGEAFKILAVGGTRRNFTLMRNVAETLQDSPSITFNIVGPPDKQSILNGLPNVRYHCGITDAALLAMYQESSCFLHLPENATANNAMLEALACGMPVICHRVGGIPEYVT
ncbi:MAG: glycosyl transferase group 1, partial [Verrucomicrobiaceae bacterium]|nr:glycosyl transferase group 1 [Verrucomicrobiaceae bacterium]